MRLILPLLILLAAPAWAQSDADLTEVELTVQETISADGVHVVHFWAPWCGNSMNELRGGLAEAVDANPNATFTFVTIRNGVDVAADVLKRHGIPDRVETLVQHDASDFLGHDVSWTPTTWIFNRGGKLAFAFNWGEVTADQLTAAIAAAQNDWHHD